MDLSQVLVAQIQAINCLLIGNVMMMKKLYVDKHKLADYFVEFYQALVAHSRQSHFDGKCNDDNECIKFNISNESTKDKRKAVLLLDDVDMQQGEFHLWCRNHS